MANECCDKWRTGRASVYWGNYNLCRILPTYCPECGSRLEPEAESQEIMKSTIEPEKKECECDIIYAGLCAKCGGTLPKHIKPIRPEPEPKEYCECGQKPYGDTPDVCLKCQKPIKPKAELPSELPETDIDIMVVSAHTAINQIVRYLRERG